MLYIPNFPLFLLIFWLTIVIIYKCVSAGFFIRFNPLSPICLIGRCCMSKNDVLKINTLGEFSLTYGKNTVNDQSSRSKKLWLLLEYLITFRDREISQNGLIELLWPEDEISNPANTLKTLLHRVRAVIAELDFPSGNELIRCRRGTYAWNNDIKAVIDCEVFESLCQSAEQETDEDKRLDYLLQAIDIYKGDFLPKAALEAWAVPISTYYHTQYIRAVHEAVDALEKRGRNEDIISVCQRATAIDPYDESLRCSMIRALYDSGSVQNAMQHYEYITKLLYSQFGVSPSEELTSLYREIVKTTNQTQTDLNIIKQQLNELPEDAVNGAFFCEYEFFKDFYRISVRSLTRHGQVIQLALVTVSPQGRLPLEPKVNAAAMDKLHGIISGALRRSDIFTRYSLTQYLIMLPSSNYENGERVLERICRNFRTSCKRLPAAISYTILPVDVQL